MKDNLKKRNNVKKKYDLVMVSGSTNYFIDAIFETSEII
jgi:hypothetical protein